MFDENISRTSCVGSCKWIGEDEIRGNKLIWRLTLCDANYATKARLDVKWPGKHLKIFPWTFIWHKSGLNTLSRYGYINPDTLSKINLNWYNETRTESSVDSANNSFLPLATHQRNWDNKRVCSDTRFVHCTVHWTHLNNWIINMYIYI